MSIPRFILLTLFTCSACGLPSGRPEGAVHADEPRSLVGCAVTAGEDGSLAVLGWTMSSAGGQILMMVYNAKQQVEAGPIWVNKGIPGYGLDADVVLDDQGTATVVWNQFDGARFDILLTQVSRSGSTVSAPHSLLDSLTHSAFTPRIARSGRTLAAVWQGFRTDGPGIYARRLSENAQSVGKIMEVSPPHSNPMSPSVDCTDSGLLAFVWQQGEESSFHVVARTADQADRMNPVVVIDSSGGLASASNPDVRILSDKIIIVWKDYRTGEANIYLQRCTTHLEPIGGNLRVNDDTVALWQRLPRIEGTDSTGIAVVWLDFRNNVLNQIGDIYAQRYLPSGMPAGKNFQVNRSPEPTVQMFPSLAMDKGGRFAVAWIDGRDDRGLEVYVQRFDERGNRVSEESAAFPPDE